MWQSRNQVNSEQKVQTKKYLKQSQFGYLQVRNLETILLKFCKKKFWTKITFPQTGLFSSQCQRLH